MRRSALLPRRSVLAALAALFAGCADDDNAGTTTDATPTTATTTTADSATETTAPASIALDVTSEVAGTDPARVGISVTVTGGPPLSTATVTLADGGSRTVSLDRERAPTFRTTVEVDGGQRHGGLVRVEDQDGERHVARFVTPWVPAPDTWDGGRTGAHYYPWYGPGRHWDAYVETPTLGEYDSRDPAILEQHAEWARAAGIDFLPVSWWGPGTYEDVALDEHLFAGGHLDEFDRCVLYEPRGRLDYDDDRADLDAPANRERLREDFAYLADTYFDREGYFAVDGRPVVYVYAVGSFAGDVAGALADVRASLDADPYVVADLVSWRTPRPKDRRRLAEFDAVTRYNPYRPLADIEEDFVERTTRWLPAWGLAAKDLGLDFWPATIPGYDDSEVPGRDNPVLLRDRDRYAALSRVVADHADPDRPAAFVTSFNEWHENTQIEPGESYGDSYLETTREQLTPGGRSRLESYVPVTLDYDRVVPEHEVNPDVPPEVSRDLALALSTVEFQGGGRVARFGVRDVRGLAFTEGTYGVGENETREWRWTGGPSARCRFYVEEEALAADVLELHGMPVVDGLSATVSVAGIPVGDLALGPRKWHVYDVDLSPTGEEPS